MLKHQEKLGIMQRLPHPPDVWGGWEIRGRTPQPPEVRGAQEEIRGRTPQPPEVRGAQEENLGRTPQPPEVRGAQEEIRGRTPQPPEVRGAQEGRKKSNHKGLTKGAKESIGRLKQLQLLQLRLGSKNQLSKKSTQPGFTLIECLLAIMIVAILLSAVAPVIVLSIATRLQARRVEQGTQAAKTYVDGVRAGKIPASAIVAVKMDEVTVVGGKNTFDPKREDFAKTPTPSSSEVDASNCVESSTYYPYCNSPTSTLYCVDLDGGGCSNKSPRDLIVQSFRSQSPAQKTAEDAALNSDALEKTIKKNGFLLGVRVYRADSFSGGRTLLAGVKDVTFTGGTGLKGEQAPLVETTTEINGKDTLYTNLCARLGGVGCPNPSPSP
ncbi:MAG: hormogonium polysaccharide secretion pseudopilin HpsB [Potamolinea sp.]